MIAPAGPLSRAGSDLINLFVRSLVDLAEQCRIGAHKHSEAMAVRRLPVAFTVVLLGYYYEADVIAANSRHQQLWICRSRKPNHPTPTVMIDESLPASHHHGIGGTVPSNPFRRFYVGVHFRDSTQVLHTGHHLHPNTRRQEAGHSDTTGHCPHETNALLSQTWCFPIERGAFASGPVRLPKSKPIGRRPETK